MGDTCTSCGAPVPGSPPSCSFCAPPVLSTTPKITKPKVHVVAERAEAR